MVESTNFLWQFRLIRFLGETTDFSKKKKKKKKDDDLKLNYCDMLYQSKNSTCIRDCEGAMELQFFGGLFESLYRKELETVKNFPRKRKKKTKKENKIK